MKYKIGNKIIQAESQIKAVQLYKILYKDSVMNDSVASTILTEIKKAYPQVKIHVETKNVRNERKTDFVFENVPGENEINNTSHNYEKVDRWTKFLKHVVSKYIPDNDSYWIRMKQLTIWQPIDEKGNTKDSLKDNQVKIGPVGFTVNEINKTFVPGSVEMMRLDFTDMLKFKRDLMDYIKGCENVIKFVERQINRGFEFSNRAYNHDSLKDEATNFDLDFLIKDEEQAIDGYKKIIAKTENPQLLNLLTHILGEETQHVEELRFAQSGNYHLDDSVNDASRLSASSAELLEEKVAHYKKLHPTWTFGEIKKGRNEFYVEVKTTDSLNDGTGYIGNAKIVNKLPQVGKTLGQEKVNDYHPNDIIVGVEKVKPTDGDYKLHKKDYDNSGYSIYGVWSRTQEEEKNAKKFHWDKYDEASYWLIAIKDSINDAMYTNLNQTLDKAKAIDLLKTAKIAEGEYWDAGNEKKGYYIQIQNVGNEIHEDVFKRPHVSPKIGSSSWGRVWYNGSIIYNNSYDNFDRKQQMIVRQNMIKAINTNKE